MEKGEQSFANVWDIDVEKYNADEGQVEEVTAEDITEDGIPEVKQAADAEGSEEADDKGDTVEGKATGVEDAVEKQGEGSEESEKDASIETPAKDEESSSLYDTVAQELVDAEILDFDDDKEYDLETSDGLKELFKENLEKNSVNAVNSYKEGLGEEAKKLLDVIEKGGSTEDYLKMDKQEDFSSIPLESDTGAQFEQNQAYLVEDWLKVQGYSAEEAADQVKEFSDAGMLRKQAELSQKKLASWQEGQNKTLMSQRETEKAEQAKSSEEEAVKFQEEVTGTREIAGFTVSEKEATKLYDYITKADKDGKTAFAKEDTEENRLLYALFAMKGFDKDKLSKEIATKQARSLKRKLTRHVDGNATPKRGAQQVRKTGQETPTIHWQM